MTIITNTFEATNPQIELLVEAIEDSKSVKGQEWKSCMTKAEYKKWLSQINIIQGHLSLILAHSAPDRTIISSLPIIIQA